MAERSTKEALINGFKKMREGFLETLENMDAIETPGREVEYGGWFNQAMEDVEGLDGLYDNSFAKLSYDELDIASFCESMIKYLEGAKGKSESHLKIKVHNR